ncbi:hypothetical protein A9G48_09330 [Gilliamella sp. wkB18]|uniref:TPM domain-containing protein n=1 Tax=Gilliamella sp. wkB18 TaxID=3120260 RepID=UPI0004DCB013|nr:TPM domain-containing protein [Gilliamella apicola]KFA58083.1 Beta-propeller domains of methanol dehydrogenase type [Gilliamella apicola]OCG61929.1 hypothetical protein A9G48_09330 [Gilliamella apicola]
MKKYLIISLLLIFNCSSFALTTIPIFNQRVVDITNTLTKSQLNELESSLIEFEQSRTDGAQIAVLMIAKLSNETVEQYADRVFINWKIGKKDADNGILLLIVKEDRLMRIEVGYGLEGTITDLIASHIIQEQLAPKFKQNNYYQGISDAITVIKNKLTVFNSHFNKSQQLTDTQSNANKGNDLISISNKVIGWAIASFFICFVFSRLVFSTLGKRVFLTAILNTLSTSGFVLWNDCSISFVLVLACFFISIYFSLHFSGAINGHSGGGFRGSLGGGIGTSRSSSRSFGKFGGGGGGRSGGGGASGRW